MRYALAVGLLFLVGLLPVWALTADQEAKLLPNDGAAGDHFGSSVALEADTVMVGAVYHDDQGHNSGAVYVFARSAGTWTQQAKLLPPAVQDFLLFGDAIALDGDNVIISAWGDDQNGDHAGAAYVFERLGDVWTEQARLTPADPAVDDYFGFAVALDGDTAVIGAWGDDDNGSRSGSAYVFVRTAGVWTQQAKLLPADGAAHDRFGEHLAFDGDTTVITARSHDHTGDNAGAAYVFVRTAGVWTQQAELLAGDGSDDDNFGQAVVLDGDTAVIGANGDDTASGSAYVFTRTGTAWTEQAKLVPADAAAHDQFGAGMALDGDTVMIGSGHDDDNGDGSGSAYVFVRHGSAWTQQAKLTASDGAPDDLFGFRIALDGDTAVLASLRDDDQGDDSGSAYVFRLYDDDVPAVGGFGLVLLLLTILGTGVYFSQRRSAH